MDINESYQCTSQSFEKNELVIIIGSDKFGDGENKWSEILMESYLYALSESSTIPNKIIFSNSGVKLTAEGSVVLESLKILESKGVKILICGACLDFYGLENKLKIGEVTNMYEIADIMNKASNTIKI
ncbi:MAG: sulfurtransferase-like selenium metabolism protein YedF [Bacillota bacterium]|nr:sulfurtransferase-like selenium metabolism protein YedF [Bacillota bacterium]